MILFRIRGKKKYRRKKGFIGGAEVQSAQATKKKRIARGTSISKRHVYSI